MIIHDFDVIGAGFRPAETDPILIVHADAVLACAIALERFETVAWRDTKIIEMTRDLQLSQFSPGNRFDPNESPDPPAIRQSFRLCGPERYDHVFILTLRVIIVKRDGLGERAEDAPVADSSHYPTPTKGKILAPWAIAREPANISFGECYAHLPRA
jgi:hypothetical protein